MECVSCPRRCKIDRDLKTGFCGVNSDIKLAKACLHFWEEPIISGAKGSGTIFFSGCNLKCVYCQNFEVSRGFGKEVSINKFIDIVKNLEDLGANNINLVTPTHFVDKIVSAFELYKPSIPIVYNTSGYESEENIKKLEGIVDVYLPDLKYADNALAKKYSQCENYFEKASKAILLMRNQIKEDVIEDNLMKKGLIIRHLMLPNALDNTIKVLEFLNNNFSKDTFISLMGQFTPIYCKNISDLNRKLKPLEYKIAIQKLIKFGFNNTFIQDLESASQDYIPDFNLDGI